MSTPIFDQIVTELMIESGSPTPCICDHAPDDCVLHPRVRFASAAEWTLSTGEVC